MDATLPLTLVGFSWGYALTAVAAFVVTFAVSLAAIAVLLVKLPSTYFLDSHERELWIDQHPVVRWSGIVAKNALGVVLILLGLALSVPGIPGQGLLTILIGLMLLDFPGKRRLERKILARPGVYKPVNRLRQAFGKAPLALHEGPLKRLTDQRSGQAAD